MEMSPNSALGTPSSSSTTTTQNASMSATNLPSNASHFLSVKLTPDNYLVWRAQMRPYLYG